MTTIRILPLWFVTLLLGACVTINIYFPAAAAEKAADRIIEEVWGPNPAQRPEQRPDQAEPPTAPEPRSEAQGGNPLVALLERLVPPAHAADPDLNIDTPAIRALRNSMQSRHARLAGYYDAGAIGLNRDGLISARDVAVVPLRERAGAKQLVVQENRDRNLLYKEISKANGRPEWEGQIRATFAQRWRHNARAGWWCQRPNGQWYKK